MLHNFVLKCRLMSCDSLCFTGGPILARVGLWHTQAANFRQVGASTQSRPSIHYKADCVHIVLPNLISQGHNLYKLQYISLEEVKIVSFQQRFQSEPIESNLSRLYLKLYTPRSNFSTSKI